MFKKQVNVNQYEFAAQKYSKIENRGIQKISEARNINIFLAKSKNM
jgi:hypothetical protein